VRKVFVKIFVNIAKYWNFKDGGIREMAGSH